MTESQYHTPVLLNESIDGLNIQPSGKYVDVTFGGGGHSSEILSRLNETGKLFGFDQDADAERNKLADSRFTLVKANFRHLKNYLRLYNASPVNGVLADLGVSSWQFDMPERGFSTRFDGPLDMRMNKQQPITAEMIVNEYEEAQLKNILKQYGELDQPGKVARLIVEQRSKEKIDTIAKLKKAVERAVPKKKEAQFHAQLFQALRIEVNQELEALKEMLQQSLEVLDSGGRLSVISYHSLEDRLVKNFMKSGNFEGTIEKDFYGNPLVPWKVITRKPIEASAEELERNSRARSAKLRIAEKL